MVFSNSLLQHVARLITINEAGTIVQATRACCELFALPMDGLIGQSFNQPVDIDAELTDPVTDLPLALVDAVPARVLTNSHLRLSVKTRATEIDGEYLVTFHLEPLLPRAEIEAIQSKTEKQLLPVGLVPDPLSLFELDHKGRLSYLSERWYSLLGEYPRQLHGTSWTKLVHPDDQSELRQLLQRTQASEPLFRYRCRIRDKQNCYRWVLCEFSAFKFDEHSSYSIVGNLLELTDEREIKLLSQAEDKRFHTLADAAPVGIFRAYVDGTTRYVNRKCLEITGRDAAQLTGASWLKYIHADDHDRVVEEFRQALQQGEEFFTEYRFVDQQQQIRWVIAQVVVELDETCVPIGLIGTLTDINELKATTEKLTQSEFISNRLERILDNSQNHILVFDEHTLRFVLTNRSARRNLGYSREQLEQLNLLDLLCEFDASEIRRLLHPLKLGIRSRITLETRLQRSNGSSYPAEMSIEYSSQEAPPAYIAFIQDVSERYAQLAAIEYQATHDALTRLPNRELLLQQLHQRIQTAAKDKHSIGLIMLDVDGFKEINEAFGHSYGNLLLQRIAERLEAELSKNTFMARLGGDEFALFIDPISSPHQALETAQRIRSSLSRPFLVEDLNLKIDASTGIALYPYHGKEAEALMRCADIAMNHAKQTGRMASVYNSALDGQNPQRLILVSQLAEALTQNQLVMEYQPKVNLRDGKMAGVEALVRWQHPSQGMMGPDLFIPAAERNEIILPLTAWILDRALADCRAWRNEGMDIKVSVNLSARNLQDPTLPKEIGALLQKHNLSSEYLKLEITESSLLTDPPRAKRVARALDNMGIRLSIDDFGTGFFSLANLRQLPVDELKIDRSFVSQMHLQADDAAIVRSTIELAHNLGLGVVAEGVENEHCWDQLANLKCDTAQGFYMARPMGAEQLLQWRS